MPQLDEFLRRLADKLFRRQVFASSGLLDLLAVLVDAGEEINGLALQPMIPSKDIREDFFVGVPDVGRGIRVVNRCGNVKRALQNVFRGCGEYYLCVRLR